MSEIAQSRIHAQIVFEQVQLWTVHVCALGRAGKDVGQGIKKAVSPDSDRGEREQKQKDDQQQKPAASF